jgi:CRISPR-associated protein Cmr3
MRTHVGIDPGSDTAQDGKLFQTEGIRFCEGRREDSGKWVTKRFGLLAQCTHPNIRPGLLHLGGERRVSDLQVATNAETMFWKAPDLGLRARVVLLTPAVFTEGAIPAQIGGAPVIAAAVGRPETISGWDMTQGNGGAPKPSRRLAPAGSVYWVDLSGVADRGAWAKTVHFQSVCSAHQDNLDGFGLAAVGVA